MEGAASLPYPLRGVANLKRRVGNCSVLCVFKGGTSSSRFDHAIEMGVVSLFFHTLWRDAFFKGRGRDTSQRQGCLLYSIPFSYLQRRMSRLLDYLILFKGKGYVTILLYSIKGVYTLKGGVCHYSIVCVRRERSLLYIMLNVQREVTYHY